ncbi:Transcription factor BIM2 [Forsythia ovata]|uniref:Transcription factor BIM2 n=1 Tax=Forsythia ovata TaxID=205694 RepID=A0ABD1TBG4_9LAMI
MKSGKSHQEEEEEEEEEFCARKDATTSNNNAKDGKNSDKANAIRSKHSVTEQRRRSKINERFQILRELIPNSDQKRDTASFLLEVIQYVQFVQEKLQKCEGSYQSWSSEPTKLMPWRNSHWRAQSFVGHPQVMKNGAGPVSMLPGRLDENNVAVPSTMQLCQQNPMESDSSRDASCRAIELQNSLANKATGMPLPLQASVPISVPNDGAFSHTLPRRASDAQSTECPATTNTLNPQEELTIEGGTINISSVYSQELLNSLTQALQSSGVDLSQASISVQINIGKRANSGSASGISITKDHEISTPPAGHFQDASNSEDLDQARKRFLLLGTVVSIQITLPNNPVFGVYVQKVYSDEAVYMQLKFGWYLTFYVVRGSR